MITGATVEALVIAGGGNGGGYPTNGVGGGGGGGGHLYNTAVSLSDASYTITVGGANQNSIFGQLIAIYGGNGGNYYYEGRGGCGQDGGCGGGGDTINGYAASGGIGSQGYNGGSGWWSSPLDVREIWLQPAAPACPACRQRSTRSAEAHPGCGPPRRCIQNRLTAPAAVQRLFRVEP